MKTAVDKVLAYFCATNIKRYRDQKRVSLLQAKLAIADLVVDEALKHAHSTPELIKIIQFQRRNRV